MECDAVCFGTKLYDVTKQKTVILMLCCSLSDITRPEFTFDELHYLLPS